MPKITVIIPVYNVEKYLTMCLDSIIAQTFSDFECILVDDGSPDNCPVICDEYAKKDNRFKVIHKKNGGASSARNAGLDVAQGEWIVFVDSDDWVDARYLELLHSNAVKENAEISICGYATFENGVTIPNRSLQDRMFTSEEAVLQQFTISKKIGRVIFCIAVNKLFKKQFIGERGLRFDETVKCAEDMLFYYNMFKTADKIYYFSQQLYFYRQHEFSVLNQKGFTPAINTAIDMFEKIYMGETNLRIKREIYALKISFIARRCFSCILYNKKDEAFLSNIRILRKTVFGKKYLPLELRCKVFGLSYFGWVISLGLKMKKTQKKKTS